MPAPAILRFIHNILACFACVGLAACSPPQVFKVFDNLPAGQVHVAEAGFPNPVPDASTRYTLPETYFFADDARSVARLLERSGTGAMVIVHRGEVVYESYHHGKDSSSRFLAWSVTKSVTSALVGIAVEEGYIDAVSDPVTKYVPELTQTAYAQATVEDVLEMASGVRFDETYWIGTDVFRLQLAVATDLSREVQGFVVSDHAPGTFNGYKSSDTQVLAMVLQNATGTTLTEYLQSRLWEPAGMTGSAEWLADKNGLEASYCCLRATVRDLAKFGLIYLNKGFYNGRQIVPEQWVLDSLNTGKPHLQPGENPQSDDTWGYGYQWWIPDDGQDYAAVGVYNQFVYVNPQAELVIAKVSAPPSYLADDREDEHIALFREISRDILLPLNGNSSHHQ